MFKRQLKERCYLLDEKLYPEGGLMGTDELRITYSYCKQLFNKSSLRNTGNAAKKKIRVDDKATQRVLKYHSMLVERGVPPQLVETYDQVKVVRLSVDLLTEMTQSRQIDGVQNIWVVKPSYNSRGFGIYCTRQLAQILSEGTKRRQNIV